MHEELWAGVEFKSEQAFFHFLKMGESLKPPENSPINVTLEASGAIIGTAWQRPFYAYLDAFLLTTRSIPEVINCCFGRDTPNMEMKKWFSGLSIDEQDRRKQFSDYFRPYYEPFAKLPLSSARNVSAHRTGYPDVTVAIVGTWGVVYEGSPIKPVPSSETPEIDNPELAFLAKSRPLRPEQARFQIDGRDLFDACREYLEAANKLIVDAHEIAERVHGDKVLTSPV